MKKVGQKDMKKGITKEMKKGKLFRVVAIFVKLSVMMVSWVYAHVKT